MAGLAGQANADNNDPTDRLERRCHVTLLFCDLCDYTALNEISDPEETMAIRRRIEQVAREIIPKHRGAINQLVGDGIFAVFGFPEADEQAVRGAVDAALELHARAAELPGMTKGHRRSLKLHSGIHSGLVFLRQGDPLHGRYELTGDAVNTAARLCSAAKRNEVLISEATLRGIEAFYEVEEMPPLTLKGKKRPVPAYKVVGRSNVETRFDARAAYRGLTPFVGRSKQLGELVAALSEASRGRGGVLCVLGDAGIGKTRLLDEFRKRCAVADFAVYRGSCENYGGVAPLRPFLQIVREMLGVPPATPSEEGALRVGRALEEIAPSLRAHEAAFLHLLSVKPWHEAAITGEHFITAVADLFKSIALKTPLVLILDDWQWSDGASVQVLARLTRAISDKRFVVVVAARHVTSEDPVLGQTDAIELRPFTENESIAVVEALVNKNVKPSVAVGIHRRSGGNPLFLEELCDSLPAGAELHDDFEESGVPGTVHALIRTRIERLEAEQSRVLSVAAVIGNELPRWLLAAIANTPNLDATVSNLLENGLIHTTESDRVFRFKHGVTREVVYESIRIRERRALHCEIARAIEERFDGVELQDHYEALASHHAGSLEYLRASEFAELAGDKASASSALDRARVQYASALAHIDDLEEDTTLRQRWLAIVAKWAASCVFNPIRDHLEVLGRAAEYATGLAAHAALAQAELWTGWIHYALGDQRVAIEHLERSRAACESAGDPRTASQVLVTIGQSYAAAGVYAEALSFLDNGIEMKRAAPPLGLGYAYAIGCRGLVHGDCGDFERAYSEIHEGLQLVQDMGHALEGSLLCLLGMTQVWHGRWHDALRTAAKGRATGERINGPYVLTVCRVVGGYAALMLAHSSSALDELRSAVEWLERREIGLYLSFCQACLAHALLESGQTESAREYAGRALERARRGDPIGEAMAHRVLALACASAGERSQATDHCMLAFDCADRRGSQRENALTRFVQAELLKSWDEPSQARALLVEALGAFERLDMTWHEAATTRLLNDL